MSETSFTLLERLQHAPGETAWQRMIDLYMPLIRNWLRRYSVDELPQLYNVLRGDMPLVGPRPHTVAHDIEYSQVIANLRSGIT